MQPVGKGAAGYGSPGTVAVTVASNVNIAATGTQSGGLYLNSAGDPFVQIGAGATVTGGVGGFGVLFDSSQNVLINAGTISTLDGAAGLAVQATGATTSISNAGTLLGNIILAGGGTNVLDNLPAGTILAGPNLNLGGAGTLRNAGTLAVAGGQPGATQINGSLVQSASGNMQIRTDKAANDQFMVTGSAQLAGAIVVRQQNPGQTMPGVVVQPIVTAQGGISIVGPLSVHAGQSAILTYGLSTGGNTMSLTTEANFSPSGLSADAARTGQFIGAIQANGSSPLMNLIVGQLVTLPSAQALGARYRSVTGDAIASVPQVTYEALTRGMGSFADRIDGWMAAGLDGGNARYVSAGLSPGSGTTASYRLWADPFGGAMSNSGLTDHIYGGAAGLDAHSDDQTLFGGIGVSGTQSYYKDGAPSLNGVASNVAINLYGVMRQGPAYLSAVTSLGGGNTSYSRGLQDIGLNLATNRLHFHDTAAAIRLEAGYGFAAGEQLRLTPFLSLQPTEIWQGGARESFGAYGPGLTYGATAIQALPLFVGIKLDGLVKMDDSASFAPFARIAWMHDFSPGRGVERSFAEMPGTYLGTTAVMNVSDAAVLRLGAKYKLTEKMSAFGALDAELSKTYRSFGANAGLQISW